MADKEKGELIKKTESNKKIVVVKKKVKKVIIKKQPHKDEAEKKKKDETEGKKNIQQESGNREKRGPQPPKGQGNKPRYSGTGAGTGTGGGGDKDKKKVFVKKGPGNRPFNNREGANKNGKTPTTPPESMSGKNDKNRKKQFQKKTPSTYGSRGGHQREELKKAFQVKKKTQIMTNPVPEQIDIIDIVSISDLAKKMNLKAGIIISKLMELGTMVTINDKIDADTASIVAEEFNCKVNVVSLYDETVIEEEVEKKEDLVKRSPIVTVMGHVDHGKTKLLDAIRTKDVVASESGGITQHIGAYSVSLESGDKITFIDTPGHEAFTMMRARGAQLTDIVILVVAADDGVKPQTIEAINHAKQANVPIIVALNKIDKPDINVDKVKQQLSDYGLLPEDWGGTTLYSEISALKKIGITELLDTVMLQAEMLELQTSEKVAAQGYVLESKIEQGRGVVATVVVLKGKLKVGDFFVAGIFSGKVRAMYNDQGKKIKVATPGMPVELTGLVNAPKAGDPFNVTKTEKEAKLISSKRQELSKMEEAKSVKKLTIKDLLSQKKAGEVQDVNVIIKADVQGSVEAIKDSLEKLSNPEVRLTTIHAGVGAINENDVNYAIASKAIIIGFHVRPNPKASELADKEKIEIKRYNIIYDVIEDIKAEIEGLIKPELQEQLIGSAEILQVFKISKVGMIAGCMVTSGKVKRNSLIRLMREDVLIHSGKISTLKRFKDDASEVIEGTECGISIENYKNIKVGDVMEAYEIKEIARTLSDIEREAEIEAKRAAKEQELAEAAEQDSKSGE